MMKLIKIILTNLLVIFFAISLPANNDFFKEGLKFYENKKFDEAKFKFEQDLVINPKSEKSYLYLSKIFNLQEKKEMEERNLDTVLLLNPKNEEAIYNLSKLKLKKSDYTESKKLNDRLLLFCKDYCQKSENLKIEIENSIRK